MTESTKVTTISSVILEVLDPLGGGGVLRRRLRSRPPVGPAVLRGSARAGSGAARCRWWCPSPATPTRCCTRRSAPVRPRSSPPRRASGATAESSKPRTGRSGRWPRRPRRTAARPPGTSTRSCCSWEWPTSARASGSTSSAACRWTRASASTCSSICHRAWSSSHCMDTRAGQGRRGPAGRLGIASHRHPRRSRLLHRPRRVHLGSRLSSRRASGLHDLVSKAAHPSIARFREEYARSSVARKGESNDMTKSTAGMVIPPATPEGADWRVSMLSRIRTLIQQADPEVVEERKWVKASNPEGVPTWYHDGLICTGETYKSHVKVTFAKGASLKDPAAPLQRRPRRQRPPCHRSSSRATRWTQRPSRRSSGKPWP